MAITKGGHHLCDMLDIISFTLGNKEVQLGSWMGKEPGDITPSIPSEELFLGTRF